ncbi:MAG TPA: redox-sensing transcriptional repressor Rex [Gemmatimonadaceae bacterium]|nr:redox-sensing transcriptional repressor Rex [Gemmatimonadaceae bacterium]
MKRVADSTVRRLSLYLRYLEEFEAGGSSTISSDELAARAGTTSAQVRKDLSVFGSFGKRGLGYDVVELTRRLRDILGLGREWRVIIVGAGKVGGALAQYRGFRQRGFSIAAVYDSDPAKIGNAFESFTVRDIASLKDDIRRQPADIAILTVPGDVAQRVLDQVVAAGIRAVLNFAPAQLHAPDQVTVKTVNMAMELEGLSFALTNPVAARSA